VRTCGHARYWSTCSCTRVAPAKSCCTTCTSECERRACSAKHNVRRYALDHHVDIIHSRSEHIYYAALAVHTDQLTRWLVLVHALGMRNADVRQWLSECGWPVTVANVFVTRTSCQLTILTLLTSRTPRICHAITAMCRASLVTWTKASWLQTPTRAQDTCCSAPSAPEAAHPCMHTPSVRG
jgi:hypothetical protein